MRLSDIVPLHLSTVVFPDFHPLAGQTGVVRGFVILHDSGPILVDTGVGFGNENIDRWYQPKSIRVDQALAGVGLDVDDLQAVVNSHLHFDHSGQNQAVGLCPIYVQSAELAAVDQPRFTIREWVRFSGANYVEVDGDREVAPGVRILPTPGHTPGHQSVAVDTDDGLVLIVGQALYSSAEYEHVAATGEMLPGDEPPDPSAYLASALRLVALDAQLVLFSHDEAALSPGMTQPA
jgi:N-acyl homoserine lactone hydrolase